MHLVINFPKFLKVFPKKLTKIILREPHVHGKIWPQSTQFWLGLFSFSNFLSRGEQEFPFPVIPKNGGLLFLLPNFGSRFFIPFLFPNFGNGFLYSLLVPEFREWAFSISWPFPHFPKPSKVIPADPRFWDILYDNLCVS